MIVPPCQHREICNTCRCGTARWRRTRGVPGGGCWGTTRRCAPRATRRPASSRCPPCSHPVRFSCNPDLLHYARLCDCAIRMWLPSFCVQRHLHISSDQQTHPCTLWYLCLPGAHICGPQIHLRENGIKKQSGCCRRRLLRESQSPELRRNWTCPSGCCRCGCACASCPAALCFQHTGFPAIQSVQPRGHLCHTAGLALTHRHRLACSVEAVRHCPGSMVRNRAPLAHDHALSRVSVLKSYPISH